MVGGESSSVGIVFYDTDKKNENAVFCRFNGEERVFKTGRKDELLDEMRKLDEPFTAEENDPTLKILALELLFFIALVALVWVFIGGFFPVFGAFVFSAASYFPVFVLICAIRSLYPDKENLERFKRFHGAEHIAVELYSDDPKIPNPEKFATVSPFHKECGTVYFSSAIILSAAFGIAFGLIPKIGFLAFVGIFLGTAVLLFLNLLNPLSPLMLFQHYTVSKPSEKEIVLAFEGISLLSELE